jgi:CheY-like chemotaxis protein
MSTPRVLLIEDNRDIVVATARLLSSRGFDVEIARNAEDGVEKAIRLRRDVIVTDAMLPNGTARDVCEQLQQQPSTRDTPVIAYTGVVDVDALAALFRLGVRVFAIKPLRARCHRRRSAHAARRAAPSDNARVVTG